MSEEFMKYVYLFGSVIVLLFFSLWLMIQYSAKKVIATMIQIKLSDLPKLAQKLSKYIKIAYGVDFASMVFEDQVKYISANLGKLPGKNYREYFPGGKNQLYCAVIALLGETLKARYHGEWIRQNANSVPVIKIDLSEEKSVFCNSSVGVVFQIAHGDNSRAIEQTMLPFGNRESLVQQYEKFAAAYQVDGDNVFLELNEAILPASPYSKMLYCYTLMPPMLVVAVGQLHIAHSVLWQVVLGVSILGTAALFCWIKRLRNITPLKGYRRMTVFSDRIVLEGEAVAPMEIILKNVTRCRVTATHNQLGEIHALHIIDHRSHLKLQEFYFINLNKVREVFTEIVERVEATKRRTP